MPVLRSSLIYAWGRPVRSVCPCWHQHEGLILLWRGVCAPVIAGGVCPVCFCDGPFEAVGGSPAVKFSAGYVMEVKVTPFSSSFARCPWNSPAERVNWPRS